MTDLTAGCTRTGPHPARDITELQARAEGHYAGKVELDDKCITASTGAPILVGMSGGPSRPEANAAYAYLTWTSFEAMKSALEGIDAAMCAGFDTQETRMAGRKALIAVREALNLARGAKP